MSSQETVEVQIGGQPGKSAKRTPFGCANEAVDMVATARAAQISDSVLRNLGAIKLIAPAKVNLFLNVGQRREDGYHDVQNIMHATTLHDVLYMRRLTDYAAEDMIMAAREAVEAREASAQDAPALAGPQGNIAVKVECISHKGVAPLAIPTHDNIVFRAIDQLACELGRSEVEAFSIRIEKHIPHQGGLGGGSSDAAAALLGAAKAWGVDEKDPVIVRVAQRLGADVAFFLQGGCALFSGCGEKLERPLEPMKKSLVYIKPEDGVSTAAAYRAFDACPVLVDGSLMEQVANAERAQDVPLVNNLAPAAEELLPELAEVREWAQRQEGVEGVLLCGSGATTFAVVENFAAAMRVAAAAQACGWWARAAAFAPLRASVVPSA